MAQPHIDAGPTPPRVNPRNLPAIKVPAGTQWTLESLLAAFGVASTSALELLLASTSFSAEVRSSNRAIAGLGRYAHPGRLWIRGYTRVQTPRGGSYVMVRTYAESIAMIDLRHRGPRSRAGRLEAFAEARASALNVARSAGAATFLVALNAPLTA